MLQISTDPGGPGSGVQTLKGVELFAELDDEARRACERRCAGRWWEPGEQILDRAAMTTDVYFVIKGRGRVIDYSLSGHREVIFDEIGEGGYFGELSAIDGEPRSANIVAVERTLTASLSGDDLIELVTSHPQAAILLMRRLTEVIRLASARIMDLSTLAAQNRIYSDLLREARTGGKLIPNTATIRPIPHHHTIAARVSTTRETVARVLSDLTRRNLLRRDKDALVITDVDMMTEMVQKFRP